MARKKYTELPIKLLDIQGDGFHLSIKGKVNGKSVNLLIDTGASRTVFDKNRIERISKSKEFEKSETLSTGLGTNSMQSEFEVFKKLQLNELVISNYKAVLLDLSHVNHSYEAIGMKPVDAVIGSDILRKHSAVIDYEKLILKLKV